MDFADAFVRNFTGTYHCPDRPRQLALSVVDGLISKYTDSRGLGFSGEPGVNVLSLNLALDKLSPAKAQARAEK